MNIHDRDEFLKTSIAAMKPILDILLSKGMSDEAAQKIIETFECCITYGFKQGEIYGKLRGGLDAADKLSRALEEQAKS